MDAPDAATVSLDELTFDLSGESVEAPDKHISNLDKTQVLDAVENLDVNLEPNKVDRYILKPTVPNEQNQIDSYNKDKFDNSLHEENDFEVDIPPLSLFTSSKGNDSEDSDSEFEVPERGDPQMQKNKVHNEDTVDDLNKFVCEEKDATKFQPEILTPRDKTTTELTWTFQKSSDQTNFADPAVLEAPAEFADVEPQPASNSSQTPFVGLSVHVPHLSGEGKLCKKNDQPFDSDKSVINEETHVQKPDIITTAEDWEGVQTVEPGFIEAGSNSEVPKAAYETKPLLTFPEAWNSFEAKDYSSVKGDIRPRIERKGFSAFTHMLFGPPKLQADLMPQRDIVFCIASTPFDNDCADHIQVLQTVYRCLTGSKFDCQRYGNHWEEIGFQGRDPATDLRGAGMLALLNLLFFLRDPSTKDLARDVYKLSLHPTQNFPFCVMGINLSRICIQVLREEIYNREINKRKDVIGTINNIYAALYLHLYKIWKQGKTIADSGFVLKEVETHSRKHVKAIFKDLEIYEKMKKQQGPLGEPAEAEPSFFSVCKEDQCDSKSAAELY